MHQGFCVVMMDALSWSWSWSWSLDTQRTDAIFVESATDWQMMWKIWFPSIFYCQIVTFFFHELDIIFFRWTHARTRIVIRTRFGYAWGPIRTRAASTSSKLIHPFVYATRYTTVYLGDGQSRFDLVNKAGYIIAIHFFHCPCCFSLYLCTDRRKFDPCCCCCMYSRTAEHDLDVFIIIN